MITIFSDGFASLDLVKVVAGALVGCGSVYFVNWLKYKLENSKLNEKSKKEEERRKRTTLSELQDILDGERDARKNSEDDCVRRITRLQAQVEDQQISINRLFLLYVEASSRRAEDYTIIMSYYSGWSRANTRLLGLQQATETIPDLPPKPTRDHQAEAEFLQRQSQQNTNFVKEEGKGI